MASMGSLTSGGAASSRCARSGGAQHAGSRSLPAVHGARALHSVRGAFASGAAPAGLASAPRATSAAKCRGRSPVAVQALFGGLQNLMKGDPSEITRKKYQPQVDAINALEPKMQALSDKELQAMTDTFKARVAGGESLENILPEAFAVVREGARRVLGLRAFDVQLMGGMVLNDGQLAEMKTGEGKTLVAVLPSYLNALAGKGVHVVTVNDYLARRDSEWVGQVHSFLGLKVGLIQQGISAEERRAAYGSDITYVTNSELGFDYLRDNLAATKDELVLERGFNFCIIDEVDSILIDEARTPLIISGQAEKPGDRYIKAKKIADVLAKDVHYTVDEKQRNVLLTEDGYEAAETVLQVNDLYDPREQWASYILNAIKAKELFIKDVGYIVRNGEIIIVDEFTGRTMPGRRWSEGLHQAMEAKEGVEIQNETITLASISYQNFFRTYPKLSGMTGTANTEVAEFANIYDLAVTVIPTNRKVSRTDEKDVVFRNESGKWKNVVVEIKRMNKTGRPVLIGTTSVEKSEYLSGLLAEEGIKHEVLNAKPENVERESEIVAQSGRVGAVTIATNMAGRGTDILLGGNAEFMARLAVREQLLPKIVSQVDENGTPFKKGAMKTWKVSEGIFPCEMSDDARKQIQSAVDIAVKSWGERKLPELEAEDRLSIACEKAPTEDEATAALRTAFRTVEAEFEAVTSVEKKQVVETGGLHVIGTERHESRRVDNQLRGRAGRQGDPGSTRYFLSLEDNLFRIFGGDKIQGMMEAFRVEDLPIESGMLTDALDNAQKKVEAYFFDIRKQLFEYDQVLNTQRDRVYGDRKKALVSSALDELMLEYADRTIDDILEANIGDAPPTDWDLEALATKVKQYCPILVDLDGEVLEKEGGGDLKKLREYLYTRGEDAYWAKVEAVEEIEKGLMTEAQRFFILTHTDNLWKEHLQAINFLRQAVGLRGYGQRDPLTEYKLEAYQLFVEMMAQIRRNVIYNVYVFEPTRLSPVDGGKGQGQVAEQSKSQNQTTSVGA